MIDTAAVLKRDYNEEGLGISREEIIRSVRDEFVPEDSLATVGRYLSAGSTNEVRRSFQIARGLDLTGRYKLIATRIALQIIQTTPLSSRKSVALIRDLVLQDTGFVAAQAALEEAREGRL